MKQRLLLIPFALWLFLPGCGNRAALPADLLDSRTAPDIASPPGDLQTAPDTPDTPEVSLDDLLSPDLAEPLDSTGATDLLLDGLDALDLVSPPEDLVVPDLPPEEKPLLRINEVVTNAPSGGPDWFELLATGDEAVYLGDYTVVDGDLTHAPVPLPSVTLQPGEFLVVEAIAAGEWSANPSVPFKFGSNDALVLALGTETVDEISWWGQSPPEGTSYGRLPDGTGNWQLTQPTAKAPNTDVKLKLSTCYDPFLWDRATPVSLALDEATWQSMLATPEAEEWQSGDFQFGPMKLTNVAIRIKGGKSIAKISAMGSHRFSFKVDFNRYVTSPWALTIWASISWWNLWTTTFSSTSISRMTRVISMRLVPPPAPSCTWGTPTPTIPVFRSRTTRPPRPIRHSSTSSPFLTMVLRATTPRLWTSTIRSSISPGTRSW